MVRRASPVVATFLLRGFARALAFGLVLGLTCCLLVSGPAQARPPRWIRHVDRIVGGHPMSVVVGDDGSVWYRRRATVARPPASNEKLLLSMALLDRFGGSHTFAVRAMGASVDADGTLSGNLYLRGQGDPEVADGRLDVLASRYLERGRAPHPRPRRRDDGSVPSGLVRARVEELLPGRLCGAAHGADVPGERVGVGRPYPGPRAPRGRVPHARAPRPRRDDRVACHRRPGRDGPESPRLGVLEAAAHDHRAHGSSLAELLGRGARQDARLRRRRGGDDRERGGRDLRVRSRSPCDGDVSRRLRPVLREPPDGARDRPSPLERREATVGGSAADGVAGRRRRDPSPPARRGPAPREDRHPGPRLRALGVGLERRHRRVDRVLIADERDG